MHLKICHKLKLKFKKNKIKNTFTVIFSKNYSPILTFFFNLTFVCVTVSLKWWILILKYLKSYFQAKLI